MAILSKRICVILLALCSEYIHAEKIKKKKKNKKNKRSGERVGAGNTTNVIPPGLSQGRGKKGKVKAKGPFHTLLEDGTPKRRGKLEITEIASQDLESLEEVDFEFLSNEKMKKFKRRNTGAMKKKNEKVWYGEDEEDLSALNMIETESGEIFGSASTAQAVYQFHTDVNGTMEVTEILTADLPPEREPRLPDNVAEVVDENGIENYENATRGLLRGGGSGVQAAIDGHRRLDDGSIIDVLVVFTKEAMCKLATGRRTSSCSVNENPIRGHIDQMVQETNQVFRNSKINTQVRLVHAYMDKNYRESGYFDDYLSHVKGKSDGKLDGVHGMRDRYGADLVVLIVAHGDSCGIGYKTYGEEDWAFSIVREDCGVGYYSFAHEIGHNFDCNHDYDASGGSNYPAYGYKDDRNGVRSIMAYDCDRGCQRIQYFSNPNVKVKNKAFGNSRANNASVINKNLRKIANFRQSEISSRTAPAPKPTPKPTPKPVAKASSSQPQSLTTSYSGTNYDNGHMFDIKAKTNLKITGMNIHLKTTNQVTVKVYTKNTPYNSGNIRKGWKIVGNTKVKGQGFKKPTPLPSSLFKTGVAINAGQTRAFYVVVTSKQLLMTKSSKTEGANIKTNNDLEIKTGRYTNFYKRRRPPFKVTKPSFDFNGSVTYVTV